MDADALRLCFEFLRLPDLMRASCVNREFRRTAREVLHSPEWLRCPWNLQAVQRKCWTSGRFSRRSFSTAALNDVFCVCIDGHVLASGGLDRRAQLWDLKASTVTSLTHSSPVRCVTLRHGLLATGCDEGRVRLYSVETARLLATTQSHAFAITALKWQCSSPADDERVGRESMELLSAGVDRHLRRWGSAPAGWAAGLRCLQEAKHKRVIRSLDCASNLIASGSDDGVVKVWLRTAEGLGLLQLISLADRTEDSSAVRTVALAADHLVAATMRGGVFVGRRSRRSGLFNLTARLPCPGVLQAVAFCGPSTLITASGRRGTNQLQMWALVEKSAHVITRLDGPMCLVLSLSAHAGRIVCGDQSGQVQLWEPSIPL
ncbi:hypothetical protein AB1Y20_013910 [Prymnesium parvum]|uniref:F-box/WD repeat-containing protein 7 n=1 Tax=Prymnesium parvum TaxID=97485 RepID=A0AB34IFI5_PRYPA